LEETLWRPNPSRSAAHGDRGGGTATRRWWRRRSGPRAENVIVQPDNKGHCVRSIASLAAVMRRDPNPLSWCCLGSFVRNERVLARGLQQAAARRASTTSTCTCSLVPKRSIPELGYILPDDRAAMAAFVRAPIHREPRSNLLGPVQDGALWNVFIVAASARALLVSILPLPGLVADMSRAVDRDGGGLIGGNSGASSVSTASTLDFSRDVVQGQGSAARAHRPGCGLERSRNAAARWPRP